MLVMVVKIIIKVGINGISIEVLNDGKLFLFSGFLVFRKVGIGCFRLLRNLGKISLV